VWLDQVAKSVAGERTDLINERRLDNGRGRSLDCGHLDETDRMNRDAVRRENTLVRLDNEATSTYRTAQSVGATPRCEQSSSSGEHKSWVAPILA
jgi:hypothetical protein